MARRELPAQRMPQAMRVIHYVDPAPHQRYPAAYDERQIRLQEQRNRELYLRWKTRQAEIRERDRKFRRFWLGFGALVGLVLVVAMFLGGWLLWTVLGLGALAVPVVLLLAGGLAVGGHRCITIVQHMH